MASTGKIVEVIFENAVETHEEQMQLLKLVSHYVPNAADMQNAGNFQWQIVQQHAPIIEGWDVSGQATDIIEETVPRTLGTPTNDYFEQRADDLRDMGFWERRGKQSGKRQASELNKRIAEMITNTGSLFYRSNVTSGYEFISEGQAILNERQSISEDTRNFLLNDRSNLIFGADLAGRQTLQGRPEKTWATGQIGQNVAEFDVYTGSFLPTLAGGASPDTTTTADISGAPQGGTVDGVTGVTTNVDYREQVIPVVASAGYAVGDRVSFAGVNAIGLEDKTDTGQPMTFVVVAIPDGTSLTLFPKPIALDDSGLTVLEKSYANINTQILSGDTVTRLNVDAASKVNPFWCKDSIEVVGGDAPLDLLNSFGGMKVVSETMSNGQKMYMAYDATLSTLQFECRLFTWYGITNLNPSANGIALTY